MADVSTKHRMLLDNVREKCRLKHFSIRTEWEWQYVFPSSRLSVDPRTNIKRRHHLDENAVNRVVYGFRRWAGNASQ